MLYFKKNLWILFYLIVFIGFLVVSLVSFNLWTQVYDNNKLKQESITKISSSSLHSFFLQYEMILDILSSDMKKNNDDISQIYNQEKFDRLMELNKNLAGLALINVDGDVLVTNSKIANQIIPNFKENIFTKDTFNQTLLEDKMVIGRTYYQKNFKSLVIPIRKSIRDKDGKVFLVLAASIKVNNGKNFLNKQLKDKSSYIISLFRNFDHYFQLLPQNNADNLHIYNEAFPTLRFNNYTLDLEQDKDIDYYKNSEDIFTINKNNFYKNNGYIVSVGYIKRYDLWMVVKNPAVKLQSLFFETFYIILFIYLILILIAFFVFKYILKFENKKRKELHYQATHDYLTCLNNRMFLSGIENSLVVDHTKPFSLFFIDMDNFKSINDNYGHIVGDRVLQEIALRLKKVISKEDILIRYSGDEFILISKIINKSEVSNLAQKILTSLSNSFRIDTLEFILGSSIGISQFPKDASNLDKIKAYADLSMYEAKKTRNTFRIFEDSIKKKYINDTKIEKQLKTSFDNKEFSMVYQPQMNCNGSLRGVEALVRWNNKELGFVSPVDFIKVVEDIGFMPKLGRFIIDTSIKDMKDIQNELKISFHLSINISVKQFLRENFYLQFMALIEKHDFDKNYLTIEITESIFIEDIGFILNVLNKFKKENIKVSLDDFGTGYSSLSLLKKLPIDELKIDKSFVDDILVNKASRNMVESIISIARNLGFYTVAEGVETKDQRDLLALMHCDIIQGYYYSKPLKIDELKAYIKNLA